jgi:hypothetical protein
MGLIEKTEHDERRARRSEALREACRGAGIGYYDDAGDEALEKLMVAFGYADKGEFAALLDSTFEAAGDNQFIAALGNAFAYRDGMDLTRRRERYLTTNPGISARTLMRYEQEGIELLVRQIELAEETIQRQREFEESEDQARDMDLAALRQRVNDLEVVVRQLLEVVAPVAKPAGANDPRRVRDAVAAIQERVGDLTGETTLAIRSEPAQG